MIKALFDKCTPDLLYDNVYGIDFEYLSLRGVKNLLFDIDNTLVPYTSPVPPDKVSEYILSLKKRGYNVCLISNNSKERVTLFNKTLELFAVHKAGKPSRRGLREALEHIGADIGETAFIGDQIFTDVLAAKRLGMFAVLVKPIDPREDLFFKLKRLGEKFFLRRYYKRLVK